MCFLEFSHNTLALYFIYLPVWLLAPDSCKGPLDPFKNNKCPLHLDCGYDVSRVPVPVGFLVKGVPPPQLEGQPSPQ